MYKARSQNTPENAKTFTHYDFGSENNLTKNTIGDGLPALLLLYPGVLLIANLGVSPRLSGIYTTNLFFVLEPPERDSAACNIVSFQTVVQAL